MGNPMDELLLNPLSDLRGCQKINARRVDAVQMVVRDGEPLEIGFEVKPESDELARMLCTPGLIEKNIHSVLFWTEEDFVPSEDPAVLAFGRRLLADGIGLDMSVVGQVRAGGLAEVEAMVVATGTTERTETT